MSHTTYGCFNRFGNIDGTVRGSQGNIPRRLGIVLTTVNSSKHESMNWGGTIGVREVENSVGLE